MKPDIERLQKLLDFLKGLKSNQFDYSKYIADTNEEGNCGTVCCAAGWVPEVFKEESPFTWEEVISDSLLLYSESPELTVSEMEIVEELKLDFNLLNELQLRLCIFFKLTREEQNALFQGHDMAQIDLGLPLVDSDSSLHDVIYLFQSFINKHQNDKA
jgi:hypothetical protein